MAVKRFIIQTEHGPALLQDAEGTSARVVGTNDAAELAIGDKEWERLHKPLKTGKLKFDKVKADYGITEEPAE